MERNFRARASSIKAKTTFTEFIHPPLFGIDCRRLGKIAKSVKGRASARANPSIPTAGASIPEEEVAACTKSVPIIGPVHEKETSASVKAIKKILMKPEAESALASIFAVHEAGSTNSKAPKNEIAKKTSSRKKATLNIALVARLFSASDPKTAETMSPSET